MESFFSFTVFVVVTLVVSFPTVPSTTIYSQMHVTSPPYDESALGSPAKPSRRIMGLLVPIWIGEQRVRALVHMDTGSDLLWVQCGPCETCYRQSNPFFYPSESSTYSDVSCYADLCRENCTADSPKCPFSLSYKDGTRASGTVGIDNITFMNPWRATFGREGILFGCSRDSYKPTSGEESGILGLNAGRYSLVTQLGGTFSYCVGNLSDRRYSRHNLLIGSEARLYGYSTHVQVHNDLYYLEVVGIAVGETQLPIDPSIFRMSPNGGGGMVLDSGTSLTYLPSAAYQALSTRVREIVGRRWTRYGDIQHHTCFYGTVRETYWFPPVTLLLGWSVNLTSGSYPVFHQASAATFCLNFVPNDNDDSPGLIGLHAQEGYNLGYDSYDHFLHLHRSDC